MYFLHTVRPDQMEKSILEVNNLGIGEGGGGSSCYLCFSIVPTLISAKKEILLKFLIAKWLSPENCILSINVKANTGKD